MAKLARKPVRVVVTGASLLVSLAVTSNAQRVLSDGVKELSTQISSSVAQQQKRKIAVIPFRDLGGQASVLDTYLSEALITELVNSSSLDVVERTLLDRILSELKLGESGLVDPNTAKRVGQVAGVDAIVTGTITDLQSYVVVNCRLIDAGTGRIFAAAETRIVKDDDVKKMMAMSTVSPDSSMGRHKESPPLARAEAPAVRPDTGGNPRAEKSPRLVYPQSVSNDPFSFTLRDCRSARTRIVCRISVAASLPTVEMIWIDTDQCYLSDRAGIQYKLVSINGRSLLGRMGVELPPGIEKPLELAFAGAGAVGDAEPASVVTRWWMRSVFYVIFK